MRSAAASYGVLQHDAGIARRSVFMLDRWHRVAYQNTAFEAGNRAHYAAVLEHLSALKG